MDFKQYVRMMLEAENAKDENKKAKDEEELEDDEDMEDEEDDEGKEASCKTHKGGCTGCEAHASVEDDEEEDDEEEDDDKEDDKEDEEEKAPKSLKESIIYSSNYIAGNTRLINEEREKVHVLTESIKNNSASKFLGKMAKKAEKDATKFSNKGEKENAKIAKDAAKSLKDASAKLYKAETDYKAGRPEAKREYKKLCKQYSKVLKQKGKVLKGIGKFTGALAGTAAGAALLGAAGLTVMANDDIIDRLEDGMKEGNLPEVLKKMAINDKEALIDLVDTFKKDGLEAAINKGKDIEKNAWKTDGYKDGKVKENIKKANEQFAKGAKEIKDDLTKKAKETKENAIDFITRKKETAKGMKAGSYAKGESGTLPSSSGYGRR